MNTELLRRGTYIRTFTGLKFYPLDPRLDEIRIEDIAHALANQCRFAGHVREFYSVAQHSVFVSKIVPECDAMWGLCHDNSGAYLGDMLRPLKNYCEYGRLYKEVEAVLMKAICQKFGLPKRMPASVIRADNIAVVTEMRDLMRTDDIGLDTGFTEQHPDHIVPLCPKDARDYFLARYTELKGCHETGSH